jgi:hypothetical protein
MLSVMRRSRLGLLAALASLAFLASVVCPCAPPATPIDSGRAHECCPPEAGIAPAASSCCAPDAATPRVSTPAAAGFASAPPAAAALEGPGVPYPVLAVATPPLSARAPLILRI